jgi:hypothetical protein
MDSGEKGMKLRKSIQNKNSMADHGFENNQKWKKVYKSSLLPAILPEGPPEEIPLKFNNKLCGKFFLIFYFVSTSARMARMFIKNKMQ